jgi:hypothetical protein
MTMTATLNSVSELAYRFRQSRVAGVAFAVLFVICIGLIALARADTGEAIRVLTFDKDSSVVSRLGTYVRATGTLLLDQPFVAQTNVAGVTLSGSKFYPLMIEGAADPLFVAEGSFPAPDANGQVTLVGRVETGSTAQPNYYLQIGDPPNISIQNNLAQLGIIGALLLLAAWLIAWLISKRDYALGASGAASEPIGIGALWFGSLGAEFGNAVVRQAPVQVTKTPHEIKLDSAGSRPAWAVRIREVVSVTPTSVATAYGPLAGARIAFQDERGLLRHGTIAVGGDSYARSELRALLNNGAIR